MNRNTISAAWLFTAVSLCAATFVPPGRSGECHADASRLGETPIWFPAVDTRAEARKFNLNDITSLQVYGPRTGRHGPPPPDVTDPKIVSIFLDALRSAVTRWPGPQPETATQYEQDVVEIHFKNRKFWYAYVLLDFPSPCFGPPFDDAIAALEKYRAEQMRAMLRERGPHIKKINLYVTDWDGAASQDFQTPQEVSSLLAEFDTLDENAFAYAQKNTDVGVELTFDDGKTQVFDLMLRDWSDAPANKRKKWPALLAAFLEQAEKSRH